MKNIIFSFAFLFLSNFLFSQQDMQLAMEYFKSSEFEKAEVLFEKLYKEKKSKFYFDYYLDCLINQEKFKEAQKKIEKEIKKHPNDLTYKVDMGYLLKKQGKESDAEKEFKSIIKNLPKNKSAIINIGNSFVRKKEYYWAEQTYLEGNKIFVNQFFQHLANVYASERNNAKMIEAYLDLLKTDSKKMATVKSVFTSYMQYDVNDEFTDILRQALIIRVQKDKLETFEELLVWFYQENADFFNAFIYAKALDKRNNENGVRIYRIGNLAFENEDFNTANKAFSYVVDKGVKFPYYFKARFALLDVLYFQVEKGDITTKEEIEDLEQKYLLIINELGISQRTVDLIVNLAHLQAFYIGKSEESITLLLEAIDIEGLSDDFKAKFMLELGDVYVYAEMPWDAVLTYAKIEDRYPNLEITDDAKFKKAKAYFYLGEFQWAKDQWDILKGSPSKLMANDAIYWSHFVDENSSYDSTQNSLKMYARADLYFYQKKYPDAIATVDSIINQYGAEPVVPQGFFLKYEIYKQNKEYQKAAMNLEKIIEQYSYVLFADKALFELAELYENELDNKEKAAEAYKTILFDYQGSLYTEPSRKKYRELSGL